MAFLQINKARVVASTAIVYALSTTLPLWAQSASPSESESQKPDVSVDVSSGGQQAAAQNGVPLSMSTSPRQRIQRPSQVSKDDGSATAVKDPTGNSQATAKPAEASVAPTPTDKPAAPPAKSNGSSPPAQSVAQVPQLMPMTPKMAPVPTPVTTAKPPQTQTGASPNHSAAPGATPGQGEGLLVEDRYPTIGQLELMTFGAPEPALAIEDRLTKLEVAVFKRDYHENTLFDRSERLKKTLLGANLDEMTSRSDTGWIDGPIGAGGQPQSVSSQPVAYFDDLAMRPENQQELPREELEKYSLELINYQRGQMGLMPLRWNVLAYQIALDQSRDLSLRRAVSHLSSKGENPDRRYTISGGSDCLLEGLVSINCDQPGFKKLNRAMVARVLKTLMSHQDDRDALLSPDATDFALGMSQTDNKDRLMACSEVVTAHGVIHAIPNNVPVGDKLEVKGVVQAPYQFDHISIAWEAMNPNAGTAADESQEALPYFPPLDYIAYGQHSESDHHTAITVLKMAGVMAAIAGGMFIPPVALAAPLIIMSGGMTGDPKPQSDIPVKGGIKVEGADFSGKIPVSNSGKEGIYYITVWANNGTGTKPVAISRRAIVTGSRAEPRVDETVVATPAVTSGSDNRDSTSKLK